MQAMSPEEGGRSRSLALLAAAQVLCSEKRYRSAGLLIEAAFPCSADLRDLVDQATRRRSWFFADQLLEQMARHDPAWAQDPWWQDARRSCDSHQSLTVPGLRFLLDLAVQRRQDHGDAAPPQGPLVYLMHMSLPQNTTGYAMRSQRFLKALMAAGIEVHAVTRPGFPDDSGLGADAAPVCIDGVTYHRIAAPGRSQAQRRAYPVQAAAALLAHLRPLRPWAILAASNHVNALPGLLAARELGIPFLYDVRGFWELSRLAHDPAYADSARFREDRALERAVAGAAEVVFTLNGAMRAELVARGVAAERITLLPNAAEPAELPLQADAERAAYAATFGLPEGVPVIGYIGSFSRYEGLDDLLCAAAILRRRGLEFRLLLIGEELPHLKGEILPELQALARSEAIEDWLILPGPVPREAVAGCYDLIDIAPIPRRNTAVTVLVSPLKPLEAMAMGKAVLVSDVPPLAELVTPGETGMIFAAGQPQALADQLERLLRDAALRTRLGQAARDWVMRARTWDMIGATARDRLAALRAAG